MTTKYLTHPERAERRARMAADYRDGTPPVDIAKKYGVCISTVNNACIENGHPGPSVRRLERNNKIIQAVAGGESVKEVAIAFGLCVETVRKIARAGGINVRGVDWHLRVVASLLKGGSRWDIAEEHTTTRAHVSSIAFRARRAGITIENTA